MINKMVKGTLVCCLLSLCSGLLVLAADHHIIDLTGFPWRVKNARRKINFTAPVPGSVYSALIDAQLIIDPYYRDADSLLKWIGEEDWTYDTYLFLSPFDYSLYTHLSSTLLVCDGLDTIAEIFINGNSAGTTDNMFRRYTLDVKHLLKLGNNSIRINFTSPVKAAASYTSKSSYIIPPECPSLVQHGECHVNQIRKSQCSFSWDWGPSFPTLGIWKDIYLQGFNTCVIRDLTAWTEKVDDQWVMYADVFLQVAEGQTAKGNVTVSFITGILYDTKQVSLTAVDSKVSFKFVIPKTIKIIPWWPNGYADGSQYLYEIYAVWNSQDGKEESSTGVINVGFRTVELIQEPVSKMVSQGDSFYFKINGMPMFFKGSNWIPADSFQERITHDKLDRLLKSAQDANINALRVWGGGVYESEDFYNLADKYGIMIWQDLMFACSMYPVYDEFLTNVKEEVTHQVRRLKHHPSIVIWSGNNENEAALAENWYHIPAANMSQYRKDYVHLYIDTIKPIVEFEDTSRPFISSSPSDGPLTKTEGWIANDPQDVHYGDIHYYSYIADLWEEKNFKTPRFASEYGVQSWCSYESLLEVFNNTDLDYHSNLSNYRQHHLFGNDEMLFQLGQHMPIPKTKDKNVLFKDLIYMTQLHSAMAIRMESEHYRRGQGILNEKGEGLTMGALYWQLNDIWQGPTWSSIEYSGKWKMLHYYAKKFFAPILISPYVEGDNLYIYLINGDQPTYRHYDSETGKMFFSLIKNPALATRRSESNQNNSKPNPDAITGTLTIQVYKYASKDPPTLVKVQYSVTKPSEKIYSSSLSSLLKQAGCSSATSCFVYLTIDNPIGPNSWLPLTPKFKFDSEGPQRTKIQILSVEKGGCDVKTFYIRLHTDLPALFVWLEAFGIAGYFHDNGFIMTPDKDMLVTFKSWDTVSIDIFKKNLTASSLTDVYHRDAEEIVNM